ncbi:CNNM domain-containing protein [Rubripirellula obstinata]|nr:CNNM domain-containing protein [Rubripirellula obstinata]
MTRTPIILCLSFLFVAFAGDSALAAGGGAPAASPVVSAAVQAFDTNGDGQIDGAEFSEMPEAFRDLDRDGDGQLSSEDLGSGGGSYDPKDLFLCVMYALIALLFSSLCSVAEAVLLSISPSYVANLEKAGKSSAAKVKSVKSNVDRSLAAILTLNTIAHTIGSGGAGAYAAKYWGDGAVGIAMIILTLLILFVSEIIPKTIGALYWRTLAPVSASFIKFLNFILYPFIFVSELITKWLAGGHSHHGFNRDEFAALAGIGAAGGHLDEKESQILQNLFRFPDLCVEDIMTPSTVVFALQENMTAHEVLQKHEKIHFSRIPIYSENRDNITGFVLKNELLMDDIRNNGETQLKDFTKRKLNAILDKTRVSEVLEKLLDNREHILIVVDEHGGLEGVVTLEDVVETLIGIEIVDEADINVNMRKVAREKWGRRMKARGIDVNQTTTKETPES